MTRCWLIGLILLFALPAWATDMQPFSRGSWAALRHQHEGRPTIVHFWGLTCGPCIVELPEWGRFARSETDAAVVMVAADPVPEESGDLAAPLAKAGLGSVEAWRFADRFAQRLQFEVDPDWHGELPLTILIGRDGSTVSQLGSTDFAELTRWVAAQGQTPTHR